MSRIEQYLSRLSPNRKSGHIIMLDADMDNVGATVITPISNDYCTNNQTSKCKGFNNINCTNSMGACKGATNVQKCMEMSEAVNLPGCG